MKQQVFVIHGGDSFGSYEEYILYLKERYVDLEMLKKKDWKGSLQDSLGEEYEVLTPRMPNKENARYVEWKIWFQRLIPLLNDNPIFIGHSMGGISLAKYLSEESYPGTIKATFLVAAPHSAPAEYTLGDFALKISLDGLSERGGKIFLYHSKDDPVVPFVDFETYRKVLPKAIARTFENRQHFEQEEFPELVQDILSISG